MIAGSLYAARRAAILLYASDEVASTPKRPEASWIVLKLKLGWRPLIMVCKAEFVSIFLLSTVKPGKFA